MQPCLFRGENVVLSRTALVIIFVGIFTICAEGVGLKKVDVAVTAYNVDRAVIKDTRKIVLAKGENWVNFSDVAALIDPTSVHLTSTGGREFEIVEQNFDYDLVGDAKLLCKYLNEYVEIVDKDDKKYEGKLLSGARQNIDRRGKTNYSYSNIVLENKSGSLSIIPASMIADVRFHGLPEGLITKPTLSWKIMSAEAGERDCEIAYMTKGMNWRADYILLLRKEEQKVDLSGLVTIDNRTGATYENARLKLVAGDVHVVEEAKMRERNATRAYAAGPTSSKPQFKEKEFFEYHLYTLQRRATLKDNETKQIDFIDAKDVNVERIYVYDGAIFPQHYDVANPLYGTETNREVDVYLEFKNSEENHLGVPLPKGKIRIKERDKSGEEEYLGEDMIEHTPVDEKLLIKVGVAFDLIGERKQRGFKRIDAHTIEEAYEIAARNHKKEDVMVRVVEHLYRYADWEIIESSHPFVKLDSKTIEFRLNIPSDGQSDLTYLVKYIR